MALVNLRDMLAHAYRNRYAVGAFDREHPLHKAFADQRFRPLAGDRISIDYIAVEDGPDNISTEGMPCRTNV